MSDGEGDGMEASRGRSSGWVSRSEQGQSTVEYALVLLALLACIVALGALWHAGRDGTLLRLATHAASHALATGEYVGSLQDLLLY